MRWPERWKRRDLRPDHSKFYMLTMWSLFIGSLCVLLRGPVHPSVLDSIMSDQTQRVYATVLCLGTGVCITGFLTGTRALFPKADLRNAYRLAMYATPANIATLSLYIASIVQGLGWHPFLIVESTAMIFAIIIAHILMAWDLHWEIKRLSAVVETARAKAQQVSDDGD